MSAAGENAPQHMFRFLKRVVHVLDMCCALCCIGHSDMLDIPLLTAKRFNANIQFTHWNNTFLLNEGGP